MVPYLSSTQTVSENDYRQDFVAVRNTEVFPRQKTMGSGLLGCRRMEKCTLLYLFLGEEEPSVYQRASGSRSRSWGCATMGMLLETWVRH